LKAVQFQGIKKLKLVDLPKPKPGPGQVLLKVSLAGICMTDLHIYLGHFPVKPPRVLGHELTGMVEAVGEGVRDDWIGCPVGIFPARFCGLCVPCQRGFQELCENFKCLGNTDDGGFAEYTVAYEEQLIVLKEINAFQGVWLEPLACVVHALSFINLKNYSSGLIIGAGSLGKLMVQVIKATNKLSLATIDPNKYKIEDSISLGADIGWTVPRSGSSAEVSDAIKSWAPDGIQFVIDTTGVPIAIERAILWAGPKAEILLFGVSDPTLKVSFNPAHFFEKELSLTASSGSTQSSFKVSHDLLASGKIDITPLVGKIITLSEIEREFDSLVQKSSAKIIIQVDRE
jgi:2-desacetyl-2-hydroxyethyl bacteriochlorophyllide A dehydrogenase